MMSKISVMAMIASALNETREDSHLNQRVSYRGELQEITATKERDALILDMVDETGFKVYVEAV
jgi:hypothetical protein